MHGGIPMLKSFKITNAYSFYDECEVSMVATGIKSHELSLITGKSNVHVPESMSLLPVLAIYGANASGKTNLLRALMFVFESINKGQDAQIFGNMYKGVRPAKEDELWVASTKVELAFLLNKNEYKLVFYYGAGGYKHETLHYRKNAKGRMLNVYNRILNTKTNKWDLTTGGTIDQELAEEIKYVHSMEHSSKNLLLHGLCKRKGVPLFYSLSNWASSFANAESPIGNTLGTTILSASGNNPDLKIFNDGEYMQDILGFIRGMNPRINAYCFDKDMDSKELLYTLGFTYDKPHWYANDSAFFDKHISRFESRGVYTAMTLLPSILSALKQGGLVIIDELENSLHPILLLRVLKMFVDPDINTGGGQLIFTTHNALIMDRRYLRQDEIGFVEQNDEGTSEFFKLSDIDGVRSDLDFCKNYILGAFGAHPLARGRE